MPAAARAEILEAQTIDGPSPDVVDVGGVAMAEDGSGGMVYRKRVGGRAHVFVSRLDDGRWQAPLRVDVGQQFDSSWPRIAAALGGRLVVVWVQEFGANTDRLFSATLDPGATRFGPPVPLDLNVGEATGTWPSVSMNRAGQALVVYRYLPNGGAPSASLPAGYVDGDIRVARYTGTYWSVFGIPIDRNQAAPVRSPTARNAPQVGVDVNGNGIVAWQEPDDEFVDRIWARRIFTQTMGVPLIVSPQSWENRPLRAPADQFALDVAGFGQGAIAFRQQPAAGTAITRPRVLVGRIPEAFDDAAKAFGTPVLADGGGAAGPAGTPSAVSVGVSPSGAFATAFGLGAASYLVRGDDDGVKPAERLDDGASAVPGDPVVRLSTESRALDAAWKVRTADGNGVAVREGGADGVDDTQFAAATRGGPVNGLLIAGSGLGDAAIAFHQGGQSFGQVAGVVIDAPPTVFTVQTPIDFVRDRRVRITWDVSPNAVTPVQYDVAVDDDVVRSDTRRRRVLLGPDDLPDGVSQIKVIAKDTRGQQTESVPATVKVDRTAPRVIAPRSSGRRLRLRITDGARREVSGVETGATVVRWGDGRRSRGGTRPGHRYARAGTYRLRVATVDQVGNRQTINLKVRVR